MYNILFKAAPQTILELCKDPKHMGADTTFGEWGKYAYESGKCSSNKQGVLMIVLPCINMNQNTSNNSWLKLLHIV